MGGVSTVGRRFMLLKRGLALCCAALMLALAWAPVAFIAVEGPDKGRERVRSLLELGYGASVLPSSRLDAAVFLDPRVVPVPQPAPVEWPGSLQDNGNLRYESPGSARSVRPRQLSPALSERPYARLVEQAADRHGVDPRLVHALIEVESGYRADAVSGSGAMGLMQLMPADGEAVRTWPTRWIRNPTSKPAPRHLRALLDEFGPLYRAGRARRLPRRRGERSALRRVSSPHPQTHRFVTPCPGHALLVTIGAGAVATDRCADGVSLPPGNRLRRDPGARPASPTARPVCGRELEKEGLSVSCRSGGVTGSISLAGSVSFQWKRRPGVREFTVFNQELAALLKAGMPLLQSLDILRQRTDQPVLKAVLDDVHEQVRGGTALSDAFDSHGDLFPGVYTASILAGEKSGNLEETLRRYVQLRRKVISGVRRRTLSALIYPAILLASVRDRGRDHRGPRRAGVHELLRLDGCDTAVRHTPVLTGVSSLWSPSSSGSSCSLSAAVAGADLGLEPAARRAARSSITCCSGFRSSAAWPRASPLHSSRGRWPPCSAGAFRS